MALKRFLTCINISFFSSYSFGISEWTKTEPEDVDKRVRRIMTMNMGFNKHSDVDRIILQRKCGGRGLICIKDFHERMYISKLGYIMTAKTVQVKAIKENLMHKREGTLLQPAEDIVSQLGLNIEFNGNQVLVDGKEASGKVAVSKIRKRQQRKHREKWEAKSIHGAVCQNAEAQEANLKASFWMDGEEKPGCSYREQGICYPGTRVGR